MCWIAAARPATPPPSALSPQIAADEWGPLELIRARRVVEGEVASLAATEARREHITAMSRALASMKSDTDRGIMPLEGDRAFHSAIVESCGNVVLIETVQRFWDSRRSPLYERLVRYFETANAWRAAITEHEAIVLAIRSHDPAAARQAMHQHMDNSHSRFSASWRQAQKLKDR